MPRFFLNSVFISLILTLLYHFGAFLPFAEKLNIGRALADVTDNSGKTEAFLPAENILVEVFLAKPYKEEKKALKEDWVKYGVKASRVRLQFFKLGDPPENIAIGSDIPASTARFAIDWALKNNKGVKYILPQFRFFKHHIVIGSSHYDEDSQIPISPEDLERLKNPKLDSEGFHMLYRQLTGEDRGNPTYLDSERFKKD